jgi:hypothetical protein
VNKVSLEEMYNKTYQLSGNQSSQKSGSRFLKPIPVPLPTVCKRNVSILLFRSWLFNNHFYVTVFVNVRHLQRLRVGQCL